MGEELTPAISSIASESKSRATTNLRRLGPASATLSSAAIAGVEVEGVGHLAPSAWRWSLWSSSLGMRRETDGRSFGQAPSGTCCQTAARICNSSSKSNSSSSGDWLKACRRSAAPSAPFLWFLKHLQCFVWNNLSKAPLGLRQMHVSRSFEVIPTHTTTSQIYTIWTRTTSNNRDKKALKKKRGTLRKLPSSSSASWHHAVFATLLRGSEDRS